MVPRAGPGLNFAKNGPDRGPITVRAEARFNSNPDHAETLSNYVKSHMKKTSIKFAKAMITNEDFVESLEIPNLPTLHFERFELG